MSAFADNSFHADGYAKSRPTYPASLYEYIFRYHLTNQTLKPSIEQSTEPVGPDGVNDAIEVGKTKEQLGGLEISTTGPVLRNSVALDVACGAGEATRALATYFETVVGMDPSVTMLNSAVKNLVQEKNSLLSSSSSSSSLPPASVIQSKVVFKTGDAESFVLEDDDDKNEATITNLDDISQELSFTPFKTKPNSLDIVTCAEGAHWFNFDAFYSNVAKALKPGGTLAIWGYGDHIYDGPGTPEQLSKAAEIEYRYVYGDDYLGPYWQQPGRSILVIRLVGHEPHPLNKNDDEKKLNSQPKFVHVERHDNLVTAKYDVFKRPSEKVYHKSHAYKLSRQLSVEQLKAYIRTYSSYHKWKKEHADTKPDIVDAMLDELISVTGWNEKTIVTISHDTFLILATKSF